MNISTDHRLAEIVDLVPGAPRVLEWFDLDYCCGGARSLASASSERGLDPAVVAGELAAAITGAGADDWATMGAAELVDHLEVTHHRYLKDELPPTARGEGGFGSTGKE